MSFLIDPYRFGFVCPDADATAFILAAGITDLTQKQAICTLVTDLKGYGLWTKMKAIYPFCGSTATQQKWNLKDPRDLDAAFRLVFSGGWTHSSNGITGNGVNSYCDTKYNTSNTIENNFSLSFYARINYTPSAGGEIDIGAYDEVASSGIMLAAEIVSNLSRLRLYLNSCDSTGTNQQGMWLGNRTTNTKLIKNGSILNTIANSGSFPITSGDISIGALRTLQTTNTYRYYTYQNYAFASIGDGLTDTEAANFYTAVQAYQTTLGRQV